MNQPPRAAAPLDPQMKAFLDATTDRGTAGVDVFTADVAVLRAQVEAGRIGYAAGGPEMARAEEFAVPGPGRLVCCRLNVPQGVPAAAPVLVLLHGGGWTWNSIHTVDRTAREYAARAGMAVLAPDYSLSPEYKFPQALNECVAVLRWVAEHGAARGLDPSRIFVGGDSAGGNLALASALALRDEGRRILRGCLLNYGVFDSDFGRESYRLYGDGTYYLSERMMRFFWRNYTATSDQTTHPLAAPLRADLAGLPPLFVGAAEVDVLADESAALAQRARAAGIVVEERVYRGMTHGFLRAVGHVEQADRCLADGAAWMRALSG
ncbi:MAG: alpha/beta hydrolase [Alphaproteobacteria bacterium]